VIKLNDYLCKKTVCVGKDVLDTCMNRDKVAASKLELIYNGVDIEQLLLSKGNREETRAGLGIAPDDPLLISVGRLAPVKNYALLIRAMDDLPNAKLILVGDGPLKDDLEHQVKARGLAHRVHFMGERHDVPALLHASDLFVMSSDNEGVSKALLEAMALGLPCVATAVGGNPEVVIDEVTGRLFQKNDRHGLVERVQRLVGDPDLMMRMGNAGAQRTRDCFSMDACVQKYLDLYRGILKQG
jgi:glycosyltransferase involved in cell wall biosynthesis